MVKFDGQREKRERFSGGEQMGSHFKPWPLSGIIDIGAADASDDVVAAGAGPSASEVLPGGALFAH